MTEKPDLEKNAYGDIIEPPFDPANVPTFDPMQEFADRGQLQQIGSKIEISTKKETPVEKIEREERDRLFYEAVMRDREGDIKQSKENKKRY